VTSFAVSSVYVRTEDSGTDREKCHNIPVDPLANPNKYYECPE